MTAPRTIVTGLFISLDGVVEAPETWHFPYMNDEMGAAVGEMYAGADTLLLGRKTYESFAAVWPQQSGEMADAINGIRKLVASTTMTSADWNNSAVIEGDVVTAVKELKQQPGGNITLTGSIGLTRTLIAAGLVDELRLLVHPIVLGTGTRLFPEGSERVPLRLTRSTTFSTGVLDLSYQPV
ncbi:dihydrofolate reductase family protein [Streptomyces sp. AN091965]|uniref:dihydrofolate reductase family protein n=1 Tax=Streptomyces sp. AN091965 TaxID=2927803 RepID=UPI001F601D61|nr:dihydrofolate reductase family protein [Streptomyces sp. AN091965]MCI3928592.1 dihydrofolate reductase family protein [Streptomyces sp. AN091965]